MSVGLIPSSALSHARSNMFWSMKVICLALLDFGRRMIREKYQNMLVIYQSILVVIQRESFHSRRGLEEEETFMTATKTFMDLTSFRDISLVLINIVHMFFCLDIYIYLS